MTAATKIDPVVVAAWERERDMDVSTSDNGYSEENVFSSLRSRDAVGQERGGDEYRDVIL